jgi:hypothetical protein
MHTRTKATATREIKNRACRGQVRAGVISALGEPRRRPLIVVITCLRAARVRRALPRAETMRNRLIFALI